MESWARVVMDLLFDLMTVFGALVGLAAIGIGALSVIYHLQGWSDDP